MYACIRLILLAIGLASGLPAVAQTTVLTSAAVLREMQGSVRIRSESGELHAAVRDQALPQGAVIDTGPDSTAVLVYPDGQICVIGERSIFRIVGYRYEIKDIAKSEVFLNLIAGSVRIVMGEIGTQNPAAVRVQVGVATMTPAPSPESRATDASVVVQGGPVAVTVQSGNVLVFLPSGQNQPIGAGQGIYLRPDGTMLRGATAQVIEQLSQVANGQDVQKQFAALQGYSEKIVQTAITLATVTTMLKEVPQTTPGPVLVAQEAAQEILKQLESLPPTAAVSTVPPPAPYLGASATPATGGGGGGGQPCPASCN